MRRANYDHHPFFHELVYVDDLINEQSIRPIFLPLVYILRVIDRFCAIISRQCVGRNFPGRRE